MIRLNLTLTTEMKLWTTMMTRKRHVFCVLLWINVTFYETAELDAIALLDDTWDNDLDPEVSAQLVQASAQACLSFGKEKGIGKGKARARADVLFVRHISRWRIGDDD